MKFNLICLFIKKNNLCRYPSILATKNTRRAWNRDGNKIKRSAKVHFQLFGRHWSGERANWFRWRPIAGRKSWPEGIHRPVEKNAHDGPGRYTYVIIHKIIRQNITIQGFNVNFVLDFIGKTNNTGWSSESRICNPRTPGGLCAL